MCCDEEANFCFVRKGQRNPETIKKELNGFYLILCVLFGCVHSHISLTAFRAISIVLITAIKLSDAPLGLFSLYCSVFFTGKIFFIT